MFRGFCVLLRVAVAAIRQKLWHQSLFFRIADAFMIAAARFGAEVKALGNLVLRLLSYLVGCRGRDLAKVMAPVFVFSHC